jgi:hypothetical protein
MTYMILPLRESEEGRMIYILGISGDKNEDRMLWCEKVKVV